MIVRVQWNLMVAEVGFEEGEEVAAGRGVDHLVDSWQGERVIGAGLVEVGVIDTHSPFLVLLDHEDWIGQPFGGVALP